MGKKTNPRKIPRTQEDCDRSYDKDRPRVEIVITPLAEPYKQWRDEKK